MSRKNVVFAALIVTVLVSGNSRKALVQGADGFVEIDGIHIEHTETQINIWRLFARGEYKSSVNDMTAKSWEFRAKLTVTGPSASPPPALHTYATIGYYNYTLAPDTEHEFEFTTIPNPSTSVPGEYKATASIDGREVGTAWTEGVFDSDDDTTEIIDEEEEED